VNEREGATVRTWVANRRLKRKLWTDNEEVVGGHCTFSQGGTERNYKKESISCKTGKGGPLKGNSEETRPCWGGARAKKLQKKPNPWGRGGRQPRGRGPGSKSGAKSPQRRWARQKTGLKELAAKKKKSLEL